MAGSISQAPSGEVATGVEACWQTAMNELGKASAPRFGLLEITAGWLERTALTGSL
jgi:hypothetical protein